MSSREERVARNEAASREINEQIEEAHEETGAEGDPERHVRMVCECGREDCDRVVGIRLDEYKQLRSDPRQFAVVEDHVAEDVEQVVSRTDRFVVVRKREGTPAAVAVSEDPED